MDAFNGDIAAGEVEAGTELALLGFFVLVGGVTVSALFDLVRWLRRSRWPETACDQCGYDLRGTNHDRCPECGAWAAATVPPH